MINYPGKQLLRVGGLLDGGVIGRVEETDDLVRETDVVNGVLGREETGADAVVDVAALESYPVAFLSLHDNTGAFVLNNPQSFLHQETTAGIPDYLRTHPMLQLHSDSATEPPAISSSVQ